MGWRIYLRRNWRVLSRIGGAVLFGLLALLLALPKASADPTPPTAVPLAETIVFSTDRLSSRSFAELFPARPGEIG